MHSFQDAAHVGLRGKPDSDHTLGEDVKMRNQGGIEYAAGTGLGANAYRLRRAPGERSVN
ncbi:hypothetical protein GCM10028792_14660 [Salinisphaera aquimarina]